MRYRAGFQALFTMGVLLGSLALLGCPKKPDVAQAGPSAVGPAASAVPETPSPAPSTAAPTEEAGEIPVARATPPTESPIPAPAPAVAEVSSLKDVFFDFDKSIIRDDQKAALAGDVAWLKANPGMKVTVEGHCDERGTSEYNLGLGARRATAVRDYLIAAGVPADQVATISYGKERPFVLGHDEKAWQLNRRGHFMATGQ